VPNFAAPAIYNLHKIFINLTDSGSFDKSILEAMACQTPVLVSNKIYERIFGEDLKSLLIFKEKDAEDLAGKIENLLKMSDLERENIGMKLRQIVEREHNLDNLIPRLVKIFESLK
jgi:glycosyltransferase involved in cell wall biosynthesis